MIAREQENIFKSFLRPSTSRHTFVYTPTHRMGKRSRAATRQSRTTTTSRPPHRRSSSSIRAVVAAATGAARRPTFTRCHRMQKRRNGRREVFVHTRSGAVYRFDMLQSATVLHVKHMIRGRRGRPAASATWRAPWRR